jgi:hypothetical protein
MAQIDDGFFAIEAAWWKWVDENCPSKAPSARGKWMRENVFIYEGVKWERDVTTYKSDSGKTIVDRLTVFTRTMAARSVAALANLTAGTMPIGIGD